MDSGLLSGPDSDGLAVFHIAYGIGLGVFQRNEGDFHINYGLCRDILIFRHYIGKKRLVDTQLISSLLKSDSIHLFSFQRIRLIRGIDLNHIIIPFFLLLQDFQSLVRIAWGDYPVGYLSFNQPCRIGIADVGKGNKIAEGGHAVCPSGPCISTGKRRKLSQVIHPVNLCQGVGQRKPHCRACRGNMLKGSGRRKAGRLLQLFHQLPAV